MVRRRVEEAVGQGPGEPGIGFGLPTTKAFTLVLALAGRETMQLEGDRLSGRAADVSISGMRGIDIAKLAMQLYDTEIGVGVASTYAHVDVRGSHARWTYLADGAEAARVIAELDAHRDRLRAGGGPRSWDIVAVGRQLQAMGYHVSEHPQFGGVKPVHSPNSYHYAGRAIDVNWYPSQDEPGKLDALEAWVKANVLGYKELLWRTTGHYDHLHLAI